MRRTNRTIMNCLLLFFWVVTINLPPRVKAAFVPDTMRSVDPSISLQQGTPDLVIERIIFSPAQPIINQAVDITVTVRNQGSALASGFYVHLYVNPAQQPPTAETADTSRMYWGLPLNPGETFEFTRTGQTFSQNGIYPIYAWVDRGNNVTESDESNNLSGPINITVAPPSPPDTYEPDDTCAQATLINTDGSDQLHNLNPSPTDVDWVKFNVTNGATYRVQGISDGPDADLSMAIMPTCDTPPSFNGAGQDFTFTAPTDGIYYLRIRHTQNSYGNNSAYRLRITTQGSCTGFFEPNDLCTTAGEITAGQAAQVHNFCKVGDSDWIAFQTEAGSSYLLETVNIGVQASPQVQIVDACTGGKVIGTGSQISILSPSSQTFYIKTTNQNGQAFGTSTNYSIQLTKATDCSPDNYEIDDSTSQAKAIIIDGSAQTRNSCPSSDIDWASFSTTPGVTYTIETSNLGSDADTIVCLLDSEGTTEIVCDDDSGPGKGSRIVWQAPGSGNYRIRVKHYKTGFAGPKTNYDLRVFTNLCLADNFEMDDTMEAAKAVSVSGDVLSHTTCPAGDVDWVRFTAGAGSHLIETTELGPEADTILELYNQQGEQIAQNDDYTSGGASQISQLLTAAQTYYVKIFHRNPKTYGTGSEYGIRIKTGTPTPPTPTPTPPPTITPTPPPPSTDVKTLILVNQAQVESKYNATRADQLVTKLQELARHSNVQGEVIRLDLNQTVVNAYTDWNANWINVEKANQVTVAIRQLIMNYLSQHQGVEYIVLAGGDQLIPFRRVLDRVPNTSGIERLYISVNSDHPTGAALRANFFLTDDYYADSEPTPFLGREIYLPDLAVGRLLETPEEMIGIIDTYLAGSSLSTTKVLVTGYDFVMDSAQGDCADWKEVLGENQVDCSLIGDTWSGVTFKNYQTNTMPPFTVQSINGHANHYEESTPLWGSGVSATDILLGSADLSRALIYTPGCHAGLNVPETNTVGMLDLAQAFLHKKANYIANTGYGWGTRGAVGLGEKLIRLVTQELLSGSQNSMGKALMKAKQRYYLEGIDLNSYDEKVLEQLTFYGLPMYTLSTGGTLGTMDDPFPSVQVASSLPGGAFGDETVLVGSLNVDLVGSQNASQVMEQITSLEGSYFSLDGSQQAKVDTPFQPLFFTGVSIPGMGARSVLWQGGRYEIIDSFTPLVAAPVTDDAPLPQVVHLAPEQWYPSLPVGLQHLSFVDHLSSQFGQFNAGSQQQRLFEALTFDVMYSVSTDFTPPEIRRVDGVYNPNRQSIEVKVDTFDQFGVERVVVTYTLGDGQWQSVDAIMNTNAETWTAILPESSDLRFLVQVLDRSANIAVDTNKGSYYTPTLVGSPWSYVFLPFLRR